ncbi:hypothetical protein INT47_011344 [Mucor saturninus]|uniref:Mediator of RNA polymerase II transcription subunit 11 n=1 Tax=Mucor saturninus TaxID=64648 RepID=A0A8H7RML3_9FUNG|nr:hypothetical protein INT47_011344 [Mucor saturninus]
MSAQNQYIDVKGHMAESTMRIKDLAQAEKKLVLLIETAAEALSILSDEAPNDENTDQFVRDRAMTFRGLAERYFSLVNDIQFALRSHTHYLTKEASITSSANKIIPFKTSVLDQYKELEIWTSAIETVSQRIAEIKKIAQEQ